MDISPSGYKKWTSTFEWIKLYDIEWIYAGPLFIHQVSQIWLDFKGISDDLNKKIGIDYFENSRRATQIQQQYAIENPKGFAHYGENGWGLTASDGPGPATRTVDGIKRKFYNYIARGAPYGRMMEPYRHGRLYLLSRFCRKLCCPRFVMRLKEGILKDIMLMVLMPAIIPTFRTRKPSLVAGFLNGNLV